MVTGKKKKKKELGPSGPGENEEKDETVMIWWCLGVGTSEEILLEMCLEKAKIETL